MSAPSPSAAPLARNPVVSEPPLEACLLLAQAVAQHGTNDWDAIAQRIAQSEHWPAEAGQMTSQVRPPSPSSRRTLDSRSGLTVTSSLDRATQAPFRNSCASADSTRASTLVPMLNLRGLTPPRTPAANNARSLSVRLTLNSRLVFKTDRMMSPQPSRPAG